MTGNHIKNGFFLSFIALTLLFSGLNTRKVIAQDLQTWFDYYLVKPIGNSIEFEVNAGYDKLLKNDGWSDLYLCSTVSWQPFGWYMADGSAEVHHTWDPSAMDLSEIRFFIGQRFNFTGYIDGINLQTPYTYLRLEQRLFSYEDGTADEKIRLRIRAGGRFLLNNDNMSTGTWYLPFYFEYFFNFNGEAMERYASRNNIVIGAGYMFNPRWRADIMYYGQRARNTIEDSFAKTDVVFQFNLRYYWLKKTQ